MNEFRQSLTKIDELIEKLSPLIIDELCFTDYEKTLAEEYISTASKLLKWDNKHPLSAEISKKDTYSKESRSRIATLTLQLCQEIFQSKTKFKKHNTTPINRDNENYFTIADNLWMVLCDIYMLTAHYTEPNSDDREALLEKVVREIRDKRLLK